MFARVVFFFRSYVGGTLHATAEDSCGIDSPKFLAAICLVKIYAELRHVFTTNRKQGDRRWCHLMQQKMSVTPIIIQ